MDTEGEEREGEREQHQSSVISGGTVHTVPLLSGMRQFIVMATGVTDRHLQEVDLNQMVN